jgi:hypothetical protein
MRSQPKPWVVELGWAGLFLALFILSRWNESPQPEPLWAEFPELPPTESGSRFAPNTFNRFAPRKPYPKRERAADRVRPRVASDTVTAQWLEARGWPDWKAQGFVRDRDRWGGVDSALMARWDDRSDFDWDLHAPAPMELNSAPEDALYQHPLWRSAQVRALHRFRSKVRPLRSLKEVFALAPFDSVQKVEIPKYFYVKN